MTQARNNHACIHMYVWMYVGMRVYICINVIWWIPPNTITRENVVLVPINTNCIYSYVCIHMHVYAWWTLLSMNTNRKKKKKNVWRTFCTADKQAVKPGVTTSQLCAAALCTVTGSFGPFGSATKMQIQMQIKALAYPRKKCPLPALIFINSYPLWGW